MSISFLYIYLLQRRTEQSKNGHDYRAHVMVINWTGHFVKLLNCQSKEKIIMQLSANLIFYHKISWFFFLDFALRCYYIYFALLQFYTIMVVLTLQKTIPSNQTKILPRLTSHFSLQSYNTHAWGGRDL